MANPTAAGGPMTNAEAKAERDKVIVAAITYYMYCEGYLDSGGEYRRSDTVEDTIVSDKIVHRTVTMPDSSGNGGGVYHEDSDAKDNVELRDFAGEFAQIRESITSTLKSYVDLPNTAELDDVAKRIASAQDFLGEGSVLRSDVDDLKNRINRTLVRGQVAEVSKHYASHIEGVVANIASLVDVLSSAVKKNHEAMTLLKSSRDAVLADAATKLADRRGDISALVGVFEWSRSMVTSAATKDVAGVVSGVLNAASAIDSMLTSSKDDTDHVGRGLSATPDMLAKFLDQSNSALRDAEESIAACVDSAYVEAAGDVAKPNFSIDLQGAVKKYSVSTSNLEIEDLSDLKLITDPGLRELSDKFREAEKMISDFSYISGFSRGAGIGLGTKGIQDSFVAVQRLAGDLLRNLADETDNLRSCLEVFESDATLTEENSAAALRRASSPVTYQPFRSEGKVRARYEEFRATYG